MFGRWRAVAMAISFAACAQRTIDRSLLDRQVSEYRGIRECTTKVRRSDHVLSWIRGRRSFALRTLRISLAFHFLSPFHTGRSVALLQNAADDGQGIGVLEAAKRDPLTILLTMLIPLAGFLTAPFARPFRISRLLWNYFIPVIPF